MPCCQSSLVRVAALSDSILADGGEWAGFARKGRDHRVSFPVEMDQAIGGATSQILLDRIDAIIALSPEILVLHAGTNDLVAAMEPASAIYARLVAMSARCLHEGINHIVILCVLPREDIFWYSAPFRHRVRSQLNTLLRRMPDDPALARYQYRISIVDLETYFDPIADTKDGLHPNHLGAEKIGLAIGRQLDRILAGSLLEPPRRVQGALARATRLGLGAFTP